jgi:hypothetical protein
VLQDILLDETRSQRVRVRVRVRVKVKVKVKVKVTAAKLIRRGRSVVCRAWLG